MAYGPTRAFARKDVLDIVRTVKSTGLPVKRLAVVGAFPLADGYGNFSNVVVMSLIFSAQTVARMNPDGIDWLSSNDVYAIADQRQVAASFISK